MDDAINNQKMLLEPKTREWLAGDDGVVALNEAWHAAVWHLRDYAPDNVSAKSRNLLKRVVCAGLELYEVNDSIARYDNLLYSENPPEQSDYFEADWTGNEDLVSQPPEDLKVIVLIAFKDEEVKEEFYRLTEENRSFLCKTAWTYIVELEALRSDRTINRFEGWSEAWGDIAISRDQRRIGYVWEDYHAYHMQEDGSKLSPWACFSMFFKEISHSEVNSLLGKKIDSVASLSARTGAKASLKELSNVRVNSTAPMWERKLCNYLLEKGYIVILEPTVRFPELGLNIHRQPDIMIIDKGRMVVIEIDSRYHLVDSKNKADRGQWQRDRDLDRLMLCNGVPVLRVWYEDVDKKPAAIFSKVVQVFEAFHRV